MALKTTIRRGRIGEPKVVPVRDYQWTDVARGRFLDHLAATCNVRAACAAAGRHHTGAYALRRRDAHFAEQWRVALENGYDTLEAALLEHAIAPLHSDDAIAVVGTTIGTAGAEFDPDRAFDLLKHHQTMQGRGARPARPGGPVPRTASEAETNAEILAALARLDARNKAVGAKAEKPRRKRAS